MWLPLIASSPPVTKPATMGLMKSSFWRKWISKHSVDENNPPHIANDPPSTGALFFISITPPNRRSFLGEYQHPLTKWMKHPATHPIPNAPPKSSIILAGQGNSREAIIFKKIYQYINSYVIDSTPHIWYMYYTILFLYIHL